MSLGWEHLGGGDIDVEWTNAEDYDAIEVHLNGETQERLAGPFGAGEAGSYSFRSLPIPQLAEIVIVPIVSAIGDGHPRLCRAIVSNDPVFEACAEEDVDFGPDDPASSVLSAGDFGAVADLQVQIAIDGSSIATLTSPSGTSIDLHYPCWLEQDTGCDDGPWGGPDITTSPILEFRINYWTLARENEPWLDRDAFRQPAVPGSLAEYFGEATEGDWTLEVVGRGEVCTGCVLRQWCLRFYDQEPAAGVKDLECVAGAESGVFDLSWTCQADYDDLRLSIDDELVETLPGPFRRGQSGSATIEIASYPSQAWLCVHGVVDGAPGPQSCCNVRTQAMTDLACMSEVGTGTVALAWTNLIEFEEIRVYVNGDLEQTLEGEVDSYSTLPQPTPSSVEVVVAGVVDGAEVTDLGCRLAVLDAATVELCDAPGAVIEANSVGAFELEVGRAIGIGRVEVLLDITGSVFWELSCTLTSPDGTTMALYGPHFLGLHEPDAVFSDRGDPYAESLADCDCLLQPNGPGDFADFSGEPAVGLWMLRVDNDFPEVEVYTLERWCLRIQ